MAAYFCADAHIGHVNIHHHRGFASMEEHDEFVLSRIADTVRSNKRDTTYYLGDVAFSREAWLKIDALPGNKIIILGNHDTERPAQVNLAFIEGLKSVNSIHSMLNLGGLVLSHCPLHREHLRGKVNVHGHLHSLLVNDRRYVNVSMEQIDYRPITIEQLRDELFKRCDIDYVHKRFGEDGVRRAVWEEKEGEFQKKWGRLPEVPEEV